MGRSSMYKRRRNLRSASSSRSSYDSPCLSASLHSRSSSLSSLSTNDDRHSKRHRTRGRNRDSRRRRHRDNERYDDRHRSRRKHSSSRGSHHGGRGLLCCSDSDIESEGNGLLEVEAPNDFAGDGLREQKLEMGIAEAEGEAEGEEPAVDDSASPRADWVCGVCSNLNSIHRIACFRCGMSYARSCRAYPSTELVAYGAAAATPSLPPAEAESLVVAAMAVAFASNRETFEPVATATRGRSVYIRFASIEMATKALMLCRCRVFVGDDGADGGRECIVEFSSAGATRSRRVGGATGILEEEEAGKGDATQAEDIDPALAKVPKELWPNTWQPPAGFASAEEERSYLGMLSEHWQVLSTQQRGYYDSGVKRALATQDDPEKLNPEATHEARPLSKPADAPTASRTSPSTSSVSDIKKRLAERKAALGKIPAPSTTVSDPSPTPASSAEDSISDLKERLARRRAQKGSGVVPAVGAASATSSIVPADPTGTGFKEGDADIQCRYGFPVPPCLGTGVMSGVDGERRATILVGVPWEIAERVLPPSLLCTATYVARNV